MFQKAEKFIERVSAEKYGRCETKTEIERIQKELNIVFPRELMEVYLKLPIIGIETQYHCSEPEEEWGFYAMEWMCIEDIIGEIKITASGEYFFAKGYLPIGMDVLGGGDYFYIDMKDEKLPVYQCYHDDYSIKKIADSIGDIFENCIIG